MEEGAKVRAEEGKEEEKVLESEEVKGETGEDLALLETKKSDRC